MNFIKENIRYCPIKDEITEKHGVSCNIIRFDEIHSLISGNKLFKLSRYIDEFHQKQKNGILTAGGAYSNHLAATAHYCKINNIPCIGIVRGERPDKLSHTLLQCEKDCMQLVFVSREAYQSISNSEEIALTYANANNHLFIPEGGYGKLGAMGACNMTKYFSNLNPSHVILPVGTGTTMAGIMSSITPQTEIIGVPVLKGMHDIGTRLSFMLESSDFNRLNIWDEFHFGGYAKYNQELIDFMNLFHQIHSVPTDFVYTGKMMFGLFDKIKKGYFNSGSNIIVIHTGGLQGNLSLPAGLLNY